MVQIPVSDDLARAIAAAGSMVILVDSAGKTIGQYQRVESSRDRATVTADVNLAVARREASKQGGKFYTTDQVLEHLHLPQ